MDEPFRLLNIDEILTTSLLEKYTVFPLVTIYILINASKMSIFMYIVTI